MKEIAEHQPPLMHTWSRLSNINIKEYMKQNLIGSFPHFFVWLLYEKQF